RLAPLRMSAAPPARRADPDDRPTDAVHPGAGGADAQAALRVRARYDAAEPALHNAAHTAPDPLAFLEAALHLLGRTAGALRARALLADDAGSPLVTVAVWAARGEAPPEPGDLDPARAAAATPVALDN